MEMINAQLAKARILQFSQGPPVRDACISHSELHCDNETFLFWVLYGPLCYTGASLDYPINPNPRT